MTPTLLSMILLYYCDSVLRLLLTWLQYWRIDGMFVIILTDLQPIEIYYWLQYSIIGIPDYIVSQKSQYWPCYYYWYSWNLLINIIDYLLLLLDMTPIVWYDWRWPLTDIIVIASWQYGSDDIGLLWLFGIVCGVLTLTYITFWRDYWHSVCLFL